MKSENIWIDGLKTAFWSVIAKRKGTHYQTVFASLTSLLILFLFAFASETCYFSMIDISFLIETRAGVKHLQTHDVFADYISSDASLPSRDPLKGSSFLCFKLNESL